MGVSRVKHVYPAWDCLFCSIIAQLYVVLVQVVGTHDASNPVKEDLGKPLLTCDVSHSCVVFGASCHSHGEALNIQSVDSSTCKKSGYSHASFPLEWEFDTLFAVTRCGNMRTTSTTATRGLDTSVSLGSDMGCYSSILMCATACGTVSGTASCSVYHRPMLSR